MNDNTKLYPTIDEFECPNYKCKNCKYFKSAFKGGCGHRIDFSKMNYAAPWFDCMPEEDGYPCKDFVPDGLYIAALPYWHGYDHWREWYNRQNEEEYAEAGRTYKRKSDDEELIGFRLKQSPNEFYYVRLSDYINGTMWDGNKLKAVKRQYYKRHKKVNEHDLGFELVREDIDGVVVEEVKED